jgi:hypothetical protein
MGGQVNGSDLRGLFRYTVNLVALAAALCSASPMMWSSGVNDQWNNVNHFSHGTTFTFVARDRNCVLGRIKRIDDSGVTVMRPHSSEIRIPRPELLRITGTAWVPGSFDPDVVSLGKLRQSPAKSATPAQPRIAPDSP